MTVCVFDFSTRFVYMKTILQTNKNKTLNPKSTICGMIYASNVEREYDELCRKSIPQTLCNGHMLFIHKLP